MTLYAHLTIILTRMLLDTPTKHSQNSFFATIQADRINDFIHGIKQIKDLCNCTPWTHVQQPLQNRPLILRSSL